MITADVNIYAIFMRANVGAPEAIVDLCVPGSIPHDHDLLLSIYSQRGFRVISLAGKICHWPLNECISVDRDAAECDLTFLGFIVFENRFACSTLFVAISAHICSFPTPPT